MRLARLFHAGRGLFCRDWSGDPLRRYGSFRPLRIADGRGSGLVFPALVLNYFGQGAVLLGNPAALEHPFTALSRMGPLSAGRIGRRLRTIIASQAVISGAFSITRQAVQLGYLPRLEVRHTSEQEIGQVYVPRINSALLVAVIILVLVFRSSDNLAPPMGSRSAA